MTKKKFLFDMSKVFVIITIIQNLTSEVRAFKFSDF